MNIIANVEQAAEAAMLEANKIGGRELDAHERGCFKLGFIAGVQHGLSVASKSLEELKEPGMIMRIRYEKQGGHYHCRLFTARGPNQTFANCGELVFSEDEWSEVLHTLERAGIQLIEERKGG